MMRNQSWPAVSKTGGMMFSAGAMFAAVGGLYSGVACVSEGVRGKADFLERRVRRPRRGTSDRDPRAVRSASASAPASRSPPPRRPRTPRGTRCAARVGSMTAPRRRASTSPTRTERYATRVLVCLENVHRVYVQPKTRALSEDFCHRASVLVVSGRLFGASRAGVASRPRASPRHGRRRRVGSVRLRRRRSRPAAGGASKRPRPDGPPDVSVAAVGGVGVASDGTGAGSDARFGAPETSHTTLHDRELRRRARAVVRGRTSTAHARGVRRRAHRRREIARAESRHRASRAQT